MMMLIIIVSPALQLHNLIESLEQPSRWGQLLLPFQRESHEQRGKVTCSRSHSKWQSWDPNQSLDPESVVLLQMGPISCSNFVPGVEELVLPAIRRFLFSASPPGHFDICGWIIPCTGLFCAL